ncbi:LexA family protein [Pseudomonas orientalis]|uniref:LexA family protein n=1 Tax=Pseudomonas orientalis TaxID=76758 RepID=UPI0012FFE046|nr:S24 family peptidase [Pseudomonas orientalis]
MLTVLGPLLIDPDPTRKAIQGKVSCGFPSPAMEYSEPPLSLDELVGLREPSRWLLRASGESLIGLGVYDRDVLIVDKALEPIDCDVVVVCIGADFVAKEFRERPGKAPLLISHNPLNASIEVGDWEEIQLWGVVLWNLHRLSR